MAYVALIDSNLTRAFNLIKDLAVIGVFTKKSGVSFDFTSGETVTTSTSTVTTKVVILDLKKTSDKSNTVRKQLLVKSKNLENLTFYDTVTINNVVWKLGEVIHSNTFTTLLDIFKEE